MLDDTGMLVGVDACVVVGIGARIWCVRGSLFGVVALVGSGLAVLVSEGVPGTSGVAVTATITGSGSLQAATSIVTNTATTIHCLFGIYLFRSLRGRFR